MIKLKLADVECFERDVKLRLPFRFGVITVTQATQAVIRATIALEGGRRSVGVAAETLAAKWFDKNPAFTDAQNLDQLRQSLALAIDAYRAKGWSTPFGLYRRSPMATQIAMGAGAWARPAGGLAMVRPCSTAPSSMRWAGARACRLLTMIRRNVPGIAATELTPDLDGLRSCRAFSAGLKPGRDIAVRPYGGPGRSDHRRATRSRASASTTACRRRWRRSSRYYRGRYYKLKVARQHRCRPRAADRASPPCSIARPATTAPRSTATSSTRMSRASPSSWRSMSARRRRSRAWSQSTLFIEQPIKRAAALARSVERAGRLQPVIIDESDGELSSFPAAPSAWLRRRLEQELQGLLQIDPQRRARAPNWNAEAGGDYFMSAEDLTTLAGRQRAAGPGAGVAAGADACRAQRPSLHRRHVVRAGGASRQTSPAPIPIFTSIRTAVARLALKEGRLRWRRWTAPASRWRRTWILQPCDRCRPRRPARITPAHPERA